MEKVPFTAEGVSAKTASLYALGDQELFAQARAAALDFRSWFETNFILEPSQQEYLAGVPEEIVLFWGYQFAAIFTGRRPVAMSGLPDKPRRTKQGNTSASVTSGYTPAKDGLPPVVSFDGGLAFTFVVEP